MRKQIEILRADLQPGDVTVTAHPGNNFIMVVRDVPEPPKPPRIAAGTTGTAMVRGKRISGMIDEDGDFNYLEYDPFDDEVSREYTTTVDFVPDSDEKPEPAKPQITREQFIQTLKKTAEDNGLVRLDHLQLDTLIVFAADRLGLR